MMEHSNINESPENAEIFNFFRENPDKRIKWNGYALVFGPFWALKHKLYTSGLTFLILGLVLLLSVGKPAILVNLYFALRGNWILFNKQTLNKSVF